MGQLDVVTVGTMGVRSGSFEIPELSQRELDGKQAALMGDYTVEIDQIHDDSVVLVVPALRLLVFGRTLDEAMSRAEASVGFRLLEPGVAGQWTSEVAGEVLHAPRFASRNTA